MKKISIFRPACLLFWLLSTTVCLSFITAYTPQASDFAQDYSSAAALRHGLPIYGESIEALSSDATDKALRIDNFHPPLNAILFLPFSFLRYSAASLLWAVVSIFFYLASLKLVFKTAEVPPRLSEAALSISLLWYPLLHNVSVGQSSMLLAFLVLLAWNFLSQRKSFSAGSLLGAAASIKLFPGLLAFYLLVKRDWRALISMIGVFSILTFLSYVIAGREDFTHYWTQMITLDVEHWESYPTNQSLTGLIAPLFTHNGWVREISGSSEVKTGLIVMLSLCIFCFTLFTAIAAQIKSTANGKTFSLFCLAMLMLSPITWTHSFIFAALAFCFLFMDALAAKNSKGLALLGVSLIMISLPDISWARFVTSLSAPLKIPWYWSAFNKIPLFGIFLLWLAMALKIRDEARTIEPSR